MEKGQAVANAKTHLSSALESVSINAKLLVVPKDDKNIEKENEIYMP